MSKKRAMKQSLDVCSVRLRSANLADISEIVDTHLAAFPDFFLSKLGSRFLALMYKSFMLEQRGLFIVATINGTFAGFALGLSTEARKDWIIALRYLPFFFVALFRPILSDFRVVTSRLINHFFCLGPSLNHPKRSIFLRSIAVSPLAQGHGIGKILLANFEQLSLISGAESIVLTTDANGNQKTLNFYIKSGYSVKQVYSQQGDRKMYLMHKILSESSLL